MLVRVISIKRSETDGLVSNRQSNRFFAKVLTQWRGMKPNRLIYCNALVFCTAESQ